MLKLLILLLLIEGGIASDATEEKEDGIDKKEIWSHVACMAMCRFRDYSVTGFAKIMRPDENLESSYNDKFSCICVKDNGKFDEIKQPRYYLEIFYDLFQELSREEEKLKNETMKFKDNKNEELNNHTVPETRHDQKKTLKEPIKKHAGPTLVRKNEKTGVKKQGEKSEVSSEEKTEKIKSNIDGILGKMGY